MLTDRRSRDDFGGINFVDDADMLSLVSPMNTFLGKDGNVIAIMGIVKRWKGVWDVWATLGDSARGHGLQLTKEVVSLLNIYADALGIRRYNSLVKSHIEENVRWTMMLGFKLEFVMEKATPEETDLLGFVKWVAIQDQ